MRNRAVIDTFERAPPSSLRRGGVLERGLFRPDSMIDTPETWRVGTKLVRDTTRIPS